MDSSCVLGIWKQIPWTLVHYFHRFRCEIKPTKMHFLGILYLGPQGVLRPEIFKRARDWPRLPSAHPSWDGGSKKFKLWKLKIGPKIQRVRRNNFRATGSILAGLFSVDVPRGRADKIGTIFYNGRPQKFVTAKNRPKFCAIFHNFRLWSRISPEQINISKIGKAPENLRPVPRWMKKSLCTAVHKRQSLFP